MTQVYYQSPPIRPYEQRSIDNARWDCSACGGSVTVGNVRWMPHKQHQRAYLHCQGCKAFSYGYGKTPLSAVKNSWARFQDRHTP